MRELGGDRGGALALGGIVKLYGDLAAVDEVSLAAEPGEFVTLLGPSGSGKTTTLRIIAGFTYADAGTVSLDGRDLTNVASYKRDIGMVFQNYALFPHMTAAENIAFPLQMRSVRKAEARRLVEEALEIVHLGGLGKRYPRQLSGGQQQRVAFARAIVFGPRLLLMDEPLGALDKKLREALQLEIIRISRDLGVTVVYVTHDQEEALVLSDRIAIYNHGRIEQVGTGEDLYERPASLFVADFIGESNFFRGRLEGDVLHWQDRRLRVSGDGSRPAPRAGAAVVVVRPERVRLRPPGEAADGENAVEGTVSEVIYLGSMRKYVVKVEPSTVVQVRVQVGEDAPAFEAGDAVAVVWRIGDGVLVADTVAASEEELEEELGPVATASAAPAD